MNKHIEEALKEIEKLGIDTKKYGERSFLKAMLEKIYILGKIEGVAESQKVIRNV